VRGTIAAFAGGYCPQSASILSFKYCMPVTHQNKFSMKMMFGAKTGLTFAVVPVLFCIFMRQAPCQADESTSTFQDTIKWLTERGHQYGTFQPKIGEEVPPVETQFALTDQCQLQVTITGGCGYGGPFDRHLYAISLSKIDPSASAIEPMSP
jgi:hypothetical protein